MSSDTIGLAECVSIALGGMIGGGIFAVLGVVAQLAEAATWLAFVLAGVVALCAAYSFNKLNELSDAAGGSVSFVQSVTGNATYAGVVGWTLLFGYVGSIAMYASAFGEFTLRLRVVPDAVAGMPLRPVVSVLAVAAFVGLNLLGARATGSTENLLVAGKVLVLVALGVGGLFYATVFDPRPLAFGVAQLPAFTPIMAAAVSFVAFQGWQLLYYDQERIESPVETIRQAVYISIPVAVAVYVVVAVVTVNLASQALRTHPHTALAEAARPLLGVFGLDGAGFTIVVLAALFSTGSAINATLFSSGYLAKGMLSRDLLPDRVGDGDADGVPERTLLGLGAVTAALTVLGSLEAITAFASLAFIAVFGVACYLAFGQRERDTVTAAVPAAGLLGTGAFLPLLFAHLYRSQPGTFTAVVVIAVGVAAVEVLYFERDALESEMATLETTVEDSISD